MSTETDTRTDTEPDLERVDVVALAAELVAIDSRNPRLVADGPGEARIVEFCRAWFDARGFETHVVASVDGRLSLIAVSSAPPAESGGGPTILLNGHLDTVGFAGTATDAPTIAGGRLTGRGAYDMKAGAAAIMVAAERAAAAGDLAGRVVVTLVADEEFGSTGTEDVLASAVVRDLDPSGAIVAEPSGGEVILAHRGFAWFEVELTGIAAHGSLPERGVDAIAHAGLVLRALDELRAAVTARGAHPLLAPGTVRVSTIAGGTDAATVADRCVLTVERRFLPGESPDEVEEELRATLDAVVAADPTVRLRLTRLVARGAFEAEPDARITRALLAAVQGHDGTAARTRGEPFWTDAGLIAEAGIPVLLLGVDGDGPHADEEWADTASIERLARVLEASIRSFCGVLPG